MTENEAIEISLEFTGFEHSPNLLAVLADHLVSPSPMVARINYRFQPRPGLERPPRSEADYEFILFGGDRPENEVGYDLRKWMPLDLFPALRDPESDVARWSKSPLRPLLDRAARTIDESTLASVAAEVHQTTSKIAALPELAAVAGAVNTQLTAMVGSQHAVETMLGFAPTDADRLLRALQMMIDGGTHLQRLIYRNYLKSKEEATADAEPRSILLTTHSPNVASVAPLTNVAVLRHVATEGHTVARSLSGIALEPAQREDLERYIDVTRGELFFSKGVLLVEGDAENFLVPTLAKLHDPTLDFDALGITVCAIGGTNFEPYTALLGSRGLNIPFAILTDFDPKEAPTAQADSDEDALPPSYGQKRAVKLTWSLMTEAEKAFNRTFEQVLALAQSKGVFLNTYTFEIDLYHSGCEVSFSETINATTSNMAMRSRFTDWLLLDDLDPKRFLKDIDSVGKGRVAQRLATILQNTGADVCPPYIKAALAYLRPKLV